MSPREERKSVGGRGNAPEYKEGRSGKSSTTRSSYGKPRKSEGRPERDFGERTGARNSSFDRDEKPAKRGFSTRREDKAERYSKPYGSDRPSRGGPRGEKSFGGRDSKPAYEERRSGGRDSSSGFEDKRGGGRSSSAGYKGSSDRKGPSKFGKSSSSFSKPRFGDRDRDGAKLNELEERVARLERLLDTLG